MRVHLRSDALEFDIAEGWHLNAHEPGQDWLIGASLDGGTASWPPGKTVLLGFSEVALNIYEGRLSVPLTEVGGLLTLHVQACSDEICLEPETATFRLL